MGKGGQKNPAVLNAAQQALANAPVAGHYMNPYPALPQALASRPSMFGLNPGGGAGQLPYVLRLNMPSPYGGGVNFPWRGHP